MKICLICNEYPPEKHGGIGIATRTLGRALVENGHQVRVLGVSAAGGTVRNIESDNGVKIWRLKASEGRFAWIRDRIQIFRTVSKWTREGVIDLVELPDFQGWAAGWPKLKIPVITRLHGSCSYFAREMAQKPQSIGYFLERASLARTDFHCSCSAYTADKTRELFGLKKKRISVLYNPVEFPEILQEENRSASRVIFTGTLTPRKGIISLIKAWPFVVANFPGAELEIFGKDGRSEQGGSMKDYLVSCLPESVRSSVHFHGHVDSQRVRCAFRSALVAVFPSYAEAFALAPMEAMAEACPTIYSRRGSGPELIDDGKNGLLVEPGDPNSIAGAVLKMLNDPAMAFRLGRAGRESIGRNFTLATMLRKNVEFYSDCIRTFRGRTEISRNAIPSFSRS